MSTLQRRGHLTVIICNYVVNIVMHIMNTINGLHSYIYSRLHCARHFTFWRLLLSILVQLVPNLCTLLTLMLLRLHSLSSPGPLPDSFSSIEQCMVYSKYVEP